MKTYQLHSPKLPEPVTFKFNSKGLLTAFESIGLTDEQLQWVYDHFPAHISSIAILRDKKKLNFVEVPEVVDFDRFFNNYSTLYGDRLDKKKAEQIWTRMSTAKQLAAYEFIPRFFNRCKRNGVAAKYAKTYLSQEPWND